MLSISRSDRYYDPKGEITLPLKLMRLIAEPVLATLYYDSRADCALGTTTGVWRGVSPCATFDSVDEFACDLSGPVHEPVSPHHGIPLYLLGNLSVQKANQVLRTDIMYPSLKGGFFICW